MEKTSLRVSSGKSKAIGAAFMVAAVIFFILFWVYLLEGVQGKVLVDGQAHWVATFMGALAYALFGGFVFGTLSFLAFSFLTFAWQKWSSWEEFDWYDVFGVTSYWIWTIISIAGFLLFVLVFWRPQL